MERRAVIAALGTGLSALAGCSNQLIGGGDSLDRSPAPESTSIEGTPTLEPRGHAVLSAPGDYAEGSLSPDGRYGVVGGHGTHGSFLVDLEDPASPSERHHLPATDDDGFHNLDVKVDPRGGLYYRTREPVSHDHGSGDDHGSGNGAGDVEIVDFGYGDGSPTDPELVGRLDSPYTHNVDPHPEEPIVYAVNHHDGADVGVEVWDVDDPTNPERLGVGWEHGALHDVVVDAGRDLLHCASGAGYGVLDISDPAAPSEIGWFRYAEAPGYSEIGEPGFQSGHYARHDPERDLVVMGDEMMGEIPGGKHVFDIGWDEGSPSEPVPIGFTHSPNAQEQTDDGRLWTTHNHDVVPLGDRTVLVSGDYSEGVVLYDITDPRSPEPVDRYPTTDGADELDIAQEPPWAWGATYSHERDFVFASDTITGVYTFDITGDG